MDDTGKGADMAKATCTVEGCDREQRAREICDMHYQRVRKFGSYELPVRPTNEERFWAKVDKNGPVPDWRPDLGPCWIRAEWVNKDTGYGLWQVGRKHKTTAHRHSYELLVGPVPDGLHIDHLCRVRTCVRPSHLEAVTPGENARRGAATRTRKTHCPKGHPKSGSNLYVTPKNQHVCRICIREYSRAFEERRRAATA